MTDTIILIVENDDNVKTEVFKDSVLFDRFMNEHWKPYWKYKIYVGWERENDETSVGGRCW